MGCDDHCRAGDGVRRATAAGVAGRAPNPADLLHTRYTVNGEPGEEEWPNFQLDGLGTWLWALGDHSHRTGHAPDAAVREAVGLAADYLAALWSLPCYDCWEEFPDEVHPHTLGAIYAGLGAAEALTGHVYGTVREAIRARVLDEGVADGRFVKYLGSDTVDASLLGLAVPYGLVAVDHPTMQRTAAEIQRTLCAGGGVHRYLDDTYYGGGQWVLLTAWLGWYLAQAGQREEAAALLAWVEAQATPEGWLPEQVPDALNDPACYDPWLRRWGEIASPLLWSHAMAIVLSKELTSTGAAYRLGRGIRCHALPEKAVG